jgi:2-keto-4-pentenoate hydratase
VTTVDTSTGTKAGADVQVIADEVFATIGTGRQITPFTSRPGGLTLDGSYRVTALLSRLYEARGDKRLGRKIGFTNRAIWEQYNVYAPIWGYVYHSTVHDLINTASLPLAGFAEPRIEPEVVFGLGRAPASDMDEAALLSCVDWVAHGFEIVQSIFPQWLQRTRSLLTACTARCSSVRGTKSDYKLRNGRKCF